MIPKKYGPILFAVILSGLMSLLVSAISTYRAIGPMPDFVSLWIDAWLTAWIFALPLVMVVAPLTQRVVRFLVANT